MSKHSESLQQELSRLSRARWATSRLICVLAELNGSLWVHHFDPICVFCGARNHLASISAVSLPELNPDQVSLTVWPLNLFGDKLASSLFNTLLLVFFLQAVNTDRLTVCLTSWTLSPIFLNAFVETSRRWNLSEILPRSSVRRPLNVFSFSTVVATAVGSTQFNVYFYLKIDETHKCWGGEVKQQVTLVKLPK